MKNLDCAQERCFPWMQGLRAGAQHDELALSFFHTEWRCCGPWMNY